MFSLTYRTGDMFKGANDIEEEHKEHGEKGPLILVHACNTLGSWGSGVALQFKEKFPFAHAKYVAYCNDYKQDTRKIVGRGIIFDNMTKKYNEKATWDKVGCLFTSEGYGRQVDPPEQIAAATKLAIIDLLSRFRTGTTLNVVSPLINSDRFKVPWEKTSKAITEASAEVSDRSLRWIVYELEGSESKRS